MDCIVIGKFLPVTTQNKQCIMDHENECMEDSMSQKGSIFIILFSKTAVKNDIPVFSILVFLCGDEQVIPKSKLIHLKKRANSTLTFCLLGNFACFFVVC